MMKNSLYLHLQDTMRTL